MRIARLALKNFRCFSDVEFTDIPETVVLVSPNGAGKSTVLEAILGIKELVQPYHRPDYETQANIDGERWHIWPPHLREPLQVGARHGSIELEIEPNEGERNYLETQELPQQLGKAVVEIHDQRRIRLTQADPIIKELFKYHSPKYEIGRIDPIRATRFYPPTGIGSPDALNDERERQILAEFHRGPADQVKFSDLKTYIHTSLSADFAHLQRTGERRNTLGTFIDVFDWFFAPKKLLGLTELAPGRFEISVHTPTGEHDIDWLSDGEKEILNILGHLFRFRALEDVVLWDTPELHLNAALEARVYRALQRTAPKNQYWIASHSIELIESVPPECLFALRQDGRGISIDRSDTPKRRKKLALYRELGARVALQLVASRVVFVEGGSDEEILRGLVPDISCHARFVDCFGVRKLRGVVDQLIEASDDENFCAICDRDDLSDDEIADFESKKPGDLYVWRRREIENYLLEPTAIWHVIQGWKILKAKPGYELEGEEEVRTALRTAADTTIEGVIAKKIEAQLSGLRGPVKPNPADLHASLNTAYERKLSELEKISPDRAAALIESTEHGVRSGWDQNWLSECLGKEAFTKFLTMHFGDMNPTVRATFIERMCCYLRENDHVPEEVSLVAEMIRRI